MGISRHGVLARVGLVIALVSCEKEEGAAPIVCGPATDQAPADLACTAEIALNAQTLISPGPVLVRITTTPDVVNVTARALGREINIQQASPGVFSGGEDIPRVPAFMRRNYDVEIVAANAEGKTARATVPVTLR